MLAKPHGKPTFGSQHRMGTVVLANWEAEEEGSLHGEALSKAPISLSLSCAHAHGKKKKKNKFE